MAIIGMFLQEGLTGSACGAGALYTVSPLRAIENELCVQAPVGFCDPAGFTADGNSSCGRVQPSFSLRGKGRVAASRGLSTLVARALGLLAARQDAGLVPERRVLQCRRQRLWEGLQS